MFKQISCLLEIPPFKGLIVFMLLCGVVNGAYASDDWTAPEYSNVSLNELAFAFIQEFNSEEFRVQKQLHYYNRDYRGGYSYIEIIFEPVHDKKINGVIGAHVATVEIEGDVRRCDPCSIEAGGGSDISEEDRASAMLIIDGVFKKLSRYKSN